MYINTVTYGEPPVDMSEICRYFGLRGDTAGLTPVRELIDECLDELLPQLAYRAAYAVLSRAEIDEISGRRSAEGVKDSIGVLNELRYFDGCDAFCIFGVTVGLAPDRLIAKYGAVSVTKAAIVESIGAERTEALADAVNADIDTLAENDGFRTLKRISPGYGSFCLGAQRDIFDILGLSKRLGMTLNSSLMMSPSKSVTAVVGMIRKAGSVR